MKPNKSFEYRGNPSEVFDSIQINAPELEPSGPLNAVVLEKIETETESSVVIVARKCNTSVHWDLTVTLDKATRERSQDIGNFSPCDCAKPTY
jgi:hypothetical protein